MRNRKTTKTESEILFSPHKFCSCRPFISTKVVVAHFPLLLLFYICGQLNRKEKKEHKMHAQCGVQVSCICNMYMNQLFIRVRVINIVFNILFFLKHALKNSFNFIWCYYTVLTYLT